MSFNDDIGAYITKIQNNFVSVVVSGRGVG